MVGFLVSIVPSAGALFLFWLALRAIFQADRRERAAIARYDAEHGSAAASPGARPGAAAPLDGEPGVDEDADGVEVPRSVPGSGV